MYKKCIYIMIGIVVFIMLSVVGIKEIYYYATPKRFVLDTFSDELISSIEKEFLFSLPNEATIEYISVTDGKDIMSRCVVKGDFNEDQFISENAIFTVIEKLNDKDNSNRISGFPNAFENMYATLQFDKEQTIMHVTIKKRGVIDKNIEEALIKRKNAEFIK